MHVSLTCIRVLIRWSKLILTISQDYWDTPRGYNIIRTHLKGYYHTLWLTLCTLLQHMLWPLQSCTWRLCSSFLTANFSSFFFNSWWHSWVSCVHFHESVTTSITGMMSWQACCWVYSSRCWLLTAYYWCLRKTTNQESPTLMAQFSFIASFWFVHNPKVPFCQYHGPMLRVEQAWIALWAWTTTQWFLLFIFAKAKQ